MSRAAASDGLFPRPFAWTDRKDTAWFGIVVAAALPSLLMLWRYTTSTGLTVFTYLVDLTVVTVAIPYLFSACAQLTYLVSRRRRVQGWLLARDLSIAGAATLFSLWVTFAAGYSAVYQAMVVVLAGIILYAFIKARRERPASRATDRRHRHRDRRDSHDASACSQRWASCARPSSTGRASSCPGSPRRTSASCCSTTCCGPSKAKEEHDAFAEILREHGVRVHYFGQLLAETLELPAGREFVLDRVCTPELLGPTLVAPLRELFEDLDGPAWPSTWSAGCSRPTCGRCGRRA